MELPYEQLVFQVVEKRYKIQSICELVLLGKSSRIDGEPLLYPRRESSPPSPLGPAAESQILI
jgi:hypothetical protein